MFFIKAVIFVAFALQRVHDEATESGMKAHDLIADALGMLIPMERSVVPSVLLIRAAVLKLRAATTHLPYMPIGKP